MSMKIKRRLASEISNKELQEFAKAEGKDGRKAEAELQKRAQKKTTSNSKPTKPVKNDTMRKAA